MPGKGQIEWVRTPQQERSRDTLHRLLDAAEELLGDRTFEELSVNDVVKRAKSSVGSFYARFQDKSALLDALYERHQQEAMNTVKQVLDPNHWAETGLAKMVEQIVRFTADLYRDHRGLLRALVIRGHLQPDWRYENPAERSKTAVAKVGELIASRAPEVAHPDPGMAGSLGFLMVMATLREKLLFGDSTSSAVGISHELLVRELTNAFLAYLGVSGLPAPGRRSRDRSPHTRTKKPTRKRV